MFNAATSNLNSTSTLVLPSNILLNPKSHATIMPAASTAFANLPELLRCLARQVRMPLQVVLTI